ncbi:MAG: tetratricopeptide repeat protein [Gemmatimonadota bacterium]|jgi:tetratricopeptide (TPR) repeat protein
MKPTALRIGLLLAVAALAACRPADQTTDTIDVQAGVRARETYPPEVVAQLDSGNAAFKAHDFEEALRHYQAAAEAGPDISATWFGVGMAQHALGNIPAADSAYARAKTEEPGASLLRPGGVPDTTER